MKKIISIMLIALMCIGLICSASAVEISYYNTFEGISSEEASQLNTISGQIYDMYDTSVFVYDDEEAILDDFRATAVSVNDTYFNSCENVLALVVDSESYNVFGFGKCESLVTEEKIEEIWNAYKVAYNTTFYSGICAFNAVALQTIGVSDGTENAVISPAPSGTAASRFLIDDAGLLSAAEFETVANKLDEIYASTGCETVIVTTNDSSINENTVNNYTDHYFMDNYGDNGGIFLISMAERDWSYNYFGTAEIKGGYTDSQIEDKLVSPLKSGNYEQAFLNFAEISYNIYTYEKTFNWGKGIIISLIIGFVIAFIVTASLKGQLKSVQMQADANVYTTPGSLNLTRSNDMFLYSNVTRTAKPKENSSGGSRSGGGGGHSGSGKF